MMNCYHAIAQLADAGEILTVVVFLIIALVGAIGEKLKSKLEESQQRKQPGSPPAEGKPSPPAGPVEVWREVLKRAKAEMEAAAPPEQRRAPGAPPTPQQANRPPRPPKPQVADARPIARPARTSGAPPRPPRTAPPRPPAQAPAETQPPRPAPTAAAADIPERATRAEARATSASAPPAAAWLRRLDRSELRRAIILREILGPPVALRDASET